MQSRIQEAAKKKWEKTNVVNFFAGNCIENGKRNIRLVNVSSGMKDSMAHPYMTVVSRQPMIDPKVIIKTVPAVRIQDRNRIIASSRKGNIGSKGSVCFYTS